MDEKLRILKMVEEGTVTAEQALELMAALGLDEKGAGEAERIEADCEDTGAVAVKRYEKKMFRIIVDSVNGDKVNVQFPVGVIKKILKVTGKLPIPDKDMQNIDMSEMMDAISECLDGEVEGDFVNVDASDGTKVRIYVGE